MIVGYLTVIGRPSYLANFLLSITWVLIYSVEDESLYRLLGLYFLTYFLLHYFVFAVFLQEMTTTTKKIMWMIIMMIMMMSVC